MSVTSFIAVSDAKITPAPATFESAASAAVGNSKNASSGDNVFSCVAKVASSIAAQITGPGASADHNPEGKPQQLKRPEPDGTEVVVIGEVDNDTDRGNQELREAPLDDKEAHAERTRSNWLELRARVQRVDPRVFAYEKDPKYLQQCAEAKQRRAALTPSAPVWQP
ncbi:hypothetical protein PRIC1_006483 [Phytophthora ramorum]|uniref:Uncharacterized protein n=1 Tax=Phytophthora ramorum TaxID=164328 RepID=H3H239_PHYRM